MPEAKEFDEGLRARLQEYREAGRERPLTMAEVGQELGVSSTTVNKYLAGKPEGDVVRLERLVADMLKAASKRQRSDVPFFPTNVTTKIWATCELIRKTNDVGLISGPAGIGKSVAIAEYAKKNATTVAISVPRWQRSDAGVCGLLFDECDTTSWDHCTPRAQYLVERLRRSNRLVIIDNAQRMTLSAREWIFDFHDKTGVPIALVGNPEVLVAIRKNDQHFSRIGIRQEIAVDQKHVAAYAKQMVDALVTEAQAGLYDLASAVAEQRGHLRALRKQLLLMIDLAATQTYAGDQVKAFTDAHTKLVRDYAL